MPDIDALLRPKWKIIVGVACVAVAIVLVFIVLYVCHGNTCSNGVLGWLEVNWKFSYLLYSILICIGMALAFSFVYGPGQGAEQAAVTWGAISFALFLFFFLGSVAECEGVSGILHVRMHRRCDRLSDRSLASALKHVRGVKVRQSAGPDRYDCRWCRSARRSAILFSTCLTEGKKDAMIFSSPSFTSRCWRR